MLTVTAVKAAVAKPDKKVTKLSDGKGLYLEVTRSGAKYWRLKYRYGGVEKVSAFGTYPDVTLAQARDRRDAARALLRGGIDPNVAKRKAVAAAVAATLDTFGAARMAWLSDFQARENLPRGGGRIAPITALTAGLHLSMAKALDPLPIAAITPAEIIAVLKPLEIAGKLETVKRVRQRLNDVFGFAVRRGLRPHNPMGDLKAEFLAPVARNHAAIVDPDRLGGLLRSCWNYRGQAMVAAALKLAPLTFVRPAELRGAL